jgi:hypothetical protein
MRPLAILNCIGKAVLKVAARQIGFGVGEVAVEVIEEVWKEQKADEKQLAVGKVGAQQISVGVGEIAADVAEEAWKDWEKQKAEEERRAELQAGRSCRRSRLWRGRNIAGTWRRW